jgi:hypothetical protein
LFYTQKSDRVNKGKEIYQFRQIVFKPPHQKKQQQKTKPSSHLIIFQR